VVVASGSLVAASLLMPAVAVNASSDSSTQQQAAGQRLVANLRGAQGGDPNGSGRAVFTLFKAAHKVCATVTYSRIRPPNGAHIHLGGPRVTNGVVEVDLTGAVTGGARCDRTVRPAVIQRILDNPRRHYFNVHNKPFPAGAIRGQLHR